MSKPLRLKRRRKPMPANGGRIEKMARSPRWSQWSQVRPERSLWVPGSHIPNGNAGAWEYFFNLFPNSWDNSWDDPI